MIQSKKEKGFTFHKAYRGSIGTLIIFGLGGILIFTIPDTNNTIDFWGNWGSAFGGMLSISAFFFSIYFANRAVQLSEKQIEMSEDQGRIIDRQIQMIQKQAELLEKQNEIANRSERLVGQIAKLDLYLFNMKVQSELEFNAINSRNKLARQLNEMRGAYTEELLKKEIANADEKIKKAHDEGFIQNEGAKKTALEITRLINEGKGIK